MSSVGDIVLAEPVVAALREARPEARIGFVVKERFRELVDGNRALDSVHSLRDGSFRSFLALVREVREARYANVIDLHVNARSLCLSKSSGASGRTAYAKRGHLDSVRVRLLRGTYRASKRIVERYLDALEPLGMRPACAPPRYHPEPRARDAAMRLLAELGLERGGFAVIVPGSVWATKRWPEDRFAQVSGRVARDLGLPVLLLGSASERELCERVAESSGARSAAGVLGLGGSAALIGEAGLFVGNDSGPTHISMALDVPTVAIFGPTDPSQFDFERHAVVYTGLRCSACSFFGGRRCRLGHWDCMLGITVDDVVSSARGLLERRSRE